MKTLIAGFIFSLSLFSATPDCQKMYHFSNRAGDVGVYGQEYVPITTGGNSISSSFNNTIQQCSSWLVSYNSEGLSALSLQFEDAPNAYSSGNAAGTFVAYAGTVLSGSNPMSTTTSNSYSATGYFPWLRMNLVSMTGTGSIDIVMQGWKSPALIGLMNQNSVNATNFGPALLTGVSYPNVQGYGLATGDTDLYLVPANKRLAIGNCNGANNTAGSVNWYPEIKVSGTYYPLSAATTVTTITNAATTNIGIILEAGESFSVNAATTAGFNVVCAAIQFDNTTSLKTVKLTGTSNGDNLIYTVSTNKTALLLATNTNSPLLAEGTGKVSFVTDSGGSRTVKLFYVPSAGTSGITNQISIATSPAASARFNFQSNATLSAGMKVIMNVDVGAASQLMWLNRIEF